MTFSVLRQKTGQLDTKAAVSSLLFIASLLFMRFFVNVTELFGNTPPFQVMMGLGLLFVFIIPAGITIAGFRHLSPAPAFLLPFALYAIVVSVFDSLWIQYNLLENPGLIMLKIIGGVGFGVIGIGASRLRENLLPAVIIIVTGILIVLTNAPNLARVFYFVVTGDSSAFAGFID